ncbi:MAG: type III-A CRISPR-associated protein Csm2 [Candidatus Caldarchaeum sp.]
MSHQSRHNQPPRKDGDAARQIIEISMNYYESDKDGVLARQVFHDWPRELSKIFGSQVKRTALRKFYDRVVTARMLMRAKPNEKEKILRDTTGDIIRYAQYQEARRVISRDAREFLIKHADYVDTNERRFEGFYQLFQSLMAYLPR